MSKAVSIISIFIFFCSCSKVKKPANEAFYDFASYFELELRNLESDTLLNLSKMVTLNKVTEQKVFIKPDWQEELSVFRRINIKPQVWQKSYTLDSFQKVDSLLTTLHFSTTDPKIEVYRIEITDTIAVLNGLPIYEKLDAPNKLIFHLRIKNALTESSKILAYLPNKGFIITGNQKTKLFEAANYRVQGIWIRGLR